MIRLTAVEGVWAGVMFIIFLSLFTENEFNELRLRCRSCFLIK